MREPAKFKGDGTLQRRKELGHYCRGRRHDITQAERGPAEKEEKEDGTFQ